MEPDVLLPGASGGRCECSGAQWKEAFILLSFCCIFRVCDSLDGWSCESPSGARRWTAVAAAAASWEMRHRR